jgi:hypothetical protein
MVTDKKPAVKRAAPKRKAALPIEEAPKKLVLEAPKNYMDKAIDLIKWVDTPFKLFEVVLLSSVFFLGYFAWDSRVVILNAITASGHQAKLREHTDLLPIAARLQKDLESLTVVVHKVNLTVNTRTTLLSLNKDGIDKSMDGTQTSMFKTDPFANQAVISMLSGEVFCGKLDVMGRTSEWEAKHGVKFVCRGGIPPEMGEFDGYLSVGFDKEPSDLAAVKTRINLAATEMAR